MSHRTWLLRAINRYHQGLMKSISSSVGLGFSLFLSEGNGRDNDLLPGNALINLMLHEALYLSDMNQHGLGEKSITW